MYVYIYIYIHNNIVTKNSVVIIIKFQIIIQCQVQDSCPFHGCVYVYGNSK